MRKLFILFAITLLSTIIFADSQTANKVKTGVNNSNKPKTIPEIIDSLEKELKISKEDTNRVNILIDLTIFKNQIKPDEALKYGEEAAILSKKIKFDKGEASALNWIGVGYTYKGKNSDALSNLEKALLLYQSLNNKKGISSVYGNIGNVYNSQSNTVKAKEYLEKALIIAEEINDQDDIGRHIGNIGIVFRIQTNYPKALEYFEKAAKISEEVGNKILLSYHLCNIGVVYQSQSNYSKSIEYLEKALNIAEEIDSKRSIGINLGNLGTVYGLQSNYPKSVEYLEKALKIAEDIDNKAGKAIYLSNIGNVYNIQSNYPKALEYFEKALKIAEEIGDKTGIGRYLGNIGVVYYKQSNYPKALEYYQKAYKKADEIGNKNMISLSLGNLGLVYKEEANYSNAQEYYLKAIKIAEEIGDKMSIGRNLGSLAEVYSLQSKYDIALVNFYKSLNISSEIGNKNGIYVQNRGIGALYLKLAKDSNIKQTDSSKKENIKLALDFLLKSLSGFKELNEDDNIRKNEEILSEIYVEIGNFKNALESFKKASKLKDTIFSKEKQKAIANIEANKELELKNNEIALKAKENELLKQKSENQALEIAKRSKELQLLSTQQKLSKFELEKKKSELRLLKKDKELTDLTIRSNQAEAKTKAKEIELLQSKQQSQEIELKTKNFQLLAAIFGIFSLVLVAFVVYRERKKSEELLLNVLPAIIAKRLKKKEHPIADHFEEASIVFIDIVGFTKSSADQDPKRVAEVLNLIYTKLDQIAKKWGLEKIKTIGDCYMAAAGVPIVDPQNPEKAANFATEAMAMLKDFDTGDGTILRFRCGVDCGPVVAGVIGEHKFIYDVWGDTVNMAARMEQNGEPDRVHVTSRFQNKITSSTPFLKGGKGDFSFTDLGEMEIKGKGLMKTYFMG